MTELNELQNSNTDGVSSNKELENTVDELKRNRVPPPKEIDKTMSPNTPLSSGPLTEKEKMIMAIMEELKDYTEDDIVDTAKNDEATNENHQEGTTSQQNDSIDEGISSSGESSESSGYQRDLPSDKDLSSRKDSSNCQDNDEGIVSIVSSGNSSPKEGMPHNESLIQTSNSLHIKDTSLAADIPDHPVARLMYYLSCVYTVLQMNDVDLVRFINYPKYKDLKEEDHDVILSLASIYNPRDLLNKVFFHNEDCDDLKNRFYEINSVQQLRAVSSTVMIGGQRRDIAKVMFFSKDWLYVNYVKPMKELKPRLKDIAALIVDTMDNKDAKPAIQQYHAPDFRVMKSVACVIL